MQSTRKNYRQPHTPQFRHKADLAPLIFPVIYIYYISGLDTYLDTADSFGGGNSVARAMLLIYALVLIFTRKISYFRILTITFPVVTFIFLAAMTQYSDFSIDRFLRGLFSLMLPLYLLSIEPTKNDRDSVMLFIMLGPGLSLAFGLIWNAIGVHPLFQESTGRLQGATIPAYLGVFGMLAVIGWVLKPATIPRHLMNILLAVNIAIMLLCAARSPLFISIYILFTIYLFSGRGIFILRFSIAGILLCALAACVFLLSGDVTERLLSSDLSGRDVIWERLAFVLSQFGDTGIGIGHQITAIDRATFIIANTVAAHNEYLRLLVEAGYWGATIFFVALAATLYNIWSTKRVSFSLPYAVIVSGFFVFCFIDNAFSLSSSPLLLMIASFGYPSNSES